MISPRLRALLPAVVALAATAALVSPAAAKMRSERIQPGLCLTTGGGKFVDIPGFPGEQIDRRLLRDLRYFERKYNIFVTDAYSHDGVHASNGEHPLGLAADIVPDEAAGGTWKDITRLAKWAEPVQNEPIPPFRWVGYNGDEGHGRGNHLHLSWDHSDARPFHPAKSVYTFKCPGKGKTDPGGTDGGTKDPGGSPDDTGGTGGGGKGGRHTGGDGPSGGVEAGGGGSGGVGPARRTYRSYGFGGPIVVETDGVSRR
jgi:hypothetical protein